jgi:hypothetical protein
MRNRKKDCITNVVSEDTNHSVKIADGTGSQLWKNGTGESWDPLEKSALENSIDIYPNPATTNITIDNKDWEKTYNTFVIYDMTGKKVMENTLKLGSNVVNIQSLNSGIFNCIFTGNGIKTIKRFVKN